MSRSDEPPVIHFHLTEQEKIVKKLRNLIFGALVTLSLAIPALPASAQEAATDPADNIEAILQDRAAETQSQRSTLLQFLERSDVEEVASASGIDLEDLQSRLGTLTDQEVSELWEQIQTVDDGLAGGDSITIASSTLIIILLIIILIQVA